MTKVMIAPSKYVQGKGVVEKIGEYTAPLGKKALVLISAGGLKRTQTVLDASFQAAEVDVTYEVFNGECSENEINRVLEIYKAMGGEVVVGIGGGKILDSAKAVAYYTKTPVAIVPTIASTDAPCSALSVIYTDEGVFSKYLFLPANPNLVLVDTEVVASAPARLLVAGMGDALATYFEARACQITNAQNCAGGSITLSAAALSELCYETLLSEGKKAKLAVEQKVVTKAVEAVVEANTLLSGLGFESGGLAGAHAIHNGFTAIEATHQFYHGEKVAFGTITQLVLENAPMEELTDVILFCKEVGLPTTLADLGITEVKPEEIMAVAKAAAVEGETIHNMPFPVTAEDVYAAILTADAMGKDLDY